MAATAFFRRIGWQKAILFLIGLVPLIGLSASMLTNPPVDPYERIAHVTGEWALRFLILTFCVTPFKEIFSFKRIGPFRRTLGVLCFVYAFAHFLSYLVLESNFDFGYFLDDLAERRYIVAGAIALFMIVPLALTSNNFSVGLLGGKRWKKLHRLVFPAVLFACLHFLLQTRGNPTEPLIYLGIAIALIAFRVVRARKKRKASAATATSGSA